MSFRLWVGLWVFFVLIVIVAFDLSALVRYITRFTEESFAVLISIIFIFESFKKLAGVWKTHPIHMYADSELKNYTCHCQHPSVAVNVSSATGVSSKYPNYGHAEAAPNHDQWTINIYEDCITHMNRIIVRSGCIRYVRYSCGALHMCVTSRLVAYCVTGTFTYVLRHKDGR